VQVGNPPFDENAAFDFHGPTFSPLPMVSGTEYQNQPHPFKLPAASPYDNFMKAAGCWSCSYTELHTIQGNWKIIMKWLEDHRGKASKHCNFTSAQGQDIYIYMCVEILVLLFWSYDMLNFGIRFYIIFFT